MEKWILKPTDYEYRWERFIVLLNMGLYCVVFWTWFVFCAIYVWLNILH